MKNPVFRKLMPLVFLFAWNSPLFAGGPGTVPSKPVNSYHQDQTPGTPVGEAYVAFTGVNSLDEVIGDLQPVFPITPQSAFQMAVPDTRNSLESALSAFSGSLGLGLTGASSSPSIPTNSAPVPGQSQSQMPTSGLTNLLATALGMDPVSEYQAAASLYEQVELMNRSLKDAPRFAGYDAFIVTVQVTLIPYRRNAPYDAYTYLSFFCGTNPVPIPPGESGESIPLVFPILTSDELEAASDQQSIDKLTSLSLALSAAYDNVGVEAALSQLNQRLNTIAGNNLNSLLTIGKVSPNTVIARLGARNSTGNANGLSMVPEAHTIAFLVLAKCNASELQMISGVSLRNTSTGTPFKELAGVQDVSSKFQEDIFEDTLLLTDEQVRGLLGTDQAKKKFIQFEQDMCNDVCDTNSDGVFQLFARV